MNPELLSWIHGLLTLAIHAFTMNFLIEVHSSTILERGTEKQNVDQQSLYFSKVGKDSLTDLPAFFCIFYESEKNLRFPFFLLKYHCTTNNTDLVIIIVCIWFCLNIEINSEHYF